ncbi:MAG: cell division ATP-binding protein FtsE [Firmicutes bacterium]|nr:cell division ATP-binding protein FtsE [Bacillota bacterium]
MIEIYHASVNYGKEVKALQDINVIIDRGEFVFVVGSSGAGKSTLLKLINREVVPSKGTVKVFGRDLTLMKRRHVPFLRRNIGMVFQDFRLLKDRNVFDNVAFALLVIGASRREINRRVPATLELVNLQDKAKKFPDQLSGGEQQRVALARAIVNRPALILADEPTGNLDPETSNEIVKLLIKINLRGTTVVMATHAKEIVDSFKRRVIYLEQGCLIGDQQEGAYNPC